MDTVRAGANTLVDPADPRDLGVRARERDVPRRRADAVRRRQGRRTHRRRSVPLRARELGDRRHRRGLCRRAARTDVRRSGPQGRARSTWSTEVVDALNRGESHIEDVPSEELEPLVESGAIGATTDYAAAREANAVLIAVPTPLSRQREPDLSYIESAARSLAPHLREGQLVVLESTTYPGTTREILQPLLEEGSGLKAGADFQPRVLARARRSRQRSLHDEDDSQGRRRRRRRVGRGRCRALRQGRSSRSTRCRRPRPPS